MTNTLPTCVTNVILMSLKLIMDEDWDVDESILETQLFKEALNLTDFSLQPLQIHILVQIKNILLK